MKKKLFAGLLAGFSIALIAWGPVGHKTVATIGYNHLSARAKDSVKALLGDTTLADIASWADAALQQPEYKSTAPWHYANVPLGLTYDAFADSIQHQKQDNVYKAVLQNAAVLQSASSTHDQRRIALKFIVHFVGDLHQPMHISRAEDKGGNTIRLVYDHNETNLHALWDSKLIGTEGKTFEQMSVAYDNASLEQITQWQNEPVMQWLWESYQVSSKIYPEIEKNNTIGKVYYQSHIDIVHERIEQAGIRLAGLLNQVFSGQKVVGIKN